MTPHSRNIVGITLGIAFVSVGIQHFVNTDLFNEIVPPYLGWPTFWTYISGILEVVLGVGIVIPRTRAYSAQLLVGLVLCLSLANLHMWMDDVPFNGTRLTTTDHIVRWCIQFLLFAVLLWLGEKIGKSQTESSTSEDAT